jgi:outer membrane lipoprotein
MGNKAFNNGRYKMKILKLIFVCLLGSLFIGCANIPASLVVSEETPLTNFTNVRANADSEVGKIARWGGVIAKVENNADNTMLEVVHFPLTSSTRPKKKDQTQGRFRLYFSGLLDPIIYKEGRSITVLGEITPTESGKIGEHEYNYPVLKASYVHLWKDIQRVDIRVSHNPHWYSPSYWHYPAPYYPRTVVVHKRSPSTKTK